MGHSRIFERGIEELIGITVAETISNGISHFFVGGMGQFDSMCAKAVRQQKKTHPHIRLYLVIPYRTAELNQNKKWYEENYDDIILPEELLGVHYKSAIQKRNKWMIDRSSQMIAFVRYTYGGAYAGYEYAKRKSNYKIINLVEK